MKTTTKYNWTDEKGKRVVFGSLSRVAVGPDSLYERVRFSRTMDREFVLVGRRGDNHVTVTISSRLGAVTGQERAHRVCMAARWFVGGQQVAEMPEVTTDDVRASQSESARELAWLAAMASSLASWQAAERR